ncbi:MAG: CRISPR-associated ring nuclease [Anaerolineae bacterium]|nr:CRISPR-associated ring nuclease [Anaerolineae bacterium]
MGRGKVRLQTLVATLGSEPQVVTIVLDRLLADGHRIDQVVAVYTAAEVVQAAMARLAGEFDGAVYPGVTLRTAPVVGPEGAVEDFRSESDVTALFNTLYHEVRDAKRQGRTVHLCVSGGRKVMGIAGMVVAQLLFGPDDRVWHLMSEGWQPGSDKRMHLRPEDRAWLVPVPVLRWTNSAALLAALGESDDPAEAIRRQEALARSEAMRRRREFVERWLTRAEREVVALACQGLDNAAIAARLHKSERTVANQLTKAYAKLGEWLGFPERAPERSVLIAELAPYFALKEGDK